MKMVIAELEGSLLRSFDTFSYLMLVAFEASGILRFALLLLLWPVIRFLQILESADTALRLATFVAVAGLRESDIKSVSRAVLPKFFMDDLDLKAWRQFRSYDRRIVVTKMPRLMVEMFVKHHLQADDVIGAELAVNRFSFLTGLSRDQHVPPPNLIPRIFPYQKHNTPSSESSNQSTDDLARQPTPVIFHDGRLVKKPTPCVAVIILIWIPVGILFAIIRILIGLILPLWVVTYVSPIFGGKIIVKGKPPASVCTGESSAGVLFVCTHRTLIDPLVLSTVLGRKIPAVTYSLSRISEILSPIPTVRLTRIRHLDASRIRHELSKGDLVVCPEGTTCREPFLLRFSSLFAELTDRIVPVAMNYSVSFFHATTARGWKALDPVFFFMNPWPVYEVTFLNQLPEEATCSAGRSPHDVANYVQSTLASVLGFKCTKLTRKDKYLLLAGNDGRCS